MGRKNIRGFNILTFFSLTAFAFTMSGCSIGYIMQAGYEEASILLSKKDINEILKEEESLEPKLRDTFELVLEAREYAKEIGLTPGGSFTEYASIDRDELVWVLSAAYQTALTPYTWWFPVVGWMPYKGFFDKADAIKEAKKFSEKGFDIYIRPSLAFSTLGWFDDPLLSTLTNLDDESLINTVFHEILHNTVWIKGHVDFNETLANFVGSKVTEMFFRKKFGDTHPLTQLCIDRLHDEIIFADFLNTLITKLRAFYTTNETLSDAEKRKGRDALYAHAITDWETRKHLLKTNRYQQSISKLNNAIILGTELYLKNLSDFNILYMQSGNSLELFLRHMKDIAREVEESEKLPYELLSALILKSAPSPSQVQSLQ